jgi:hypothetical protein
MHLVLNSLDALGIVQHAKAASEYHLLLDRATIVEKAMRARHEHCLNSSPELIEALLNHHRPKVLAPLHAARLDAFTALTNDAKQTQHSLNSQLVFSSPSVRRLCLKTEKYGRKRETHTSRERPPSSRSSRLEALNDSAWLHPVGTARQTLISQIAASKSMFDRPLN